MFLIVVILMSEDVGYVAFVTGQDALGVRMSQNYLDVTGRGAGADGPNFSCCFHFCFYIGEFAFVLMRRVFP